MKKMMLLILATLTLACGTRSGIATDTGLAWSEDLAAAAEQAKESQRHLLVNFSGSDWCGWCIKLDHEVFSQPAFQEYAAENLVPVLLDFPRRKTQSAELKAQNERLMRHFRVQGFPTLLLFNPAGELVGELGYTPGGPPAFIQSIQQAQARFQMRPANSPPPAKLPL
jgi:protein disulfide-isomerase